MSKTDKLKQQVIDAAFVTPLVPKREPGAHKWGVGGLIAVAGGPTYVGAAALVAMAAGRAGAGVVSLAIPRGAIGAIVSLVPEAVFIPLLDGDPETAAKRGLEAITTKLERNTALLIGPGLGEDEHAGAIMNALFNGQAAPKVTSLGFSVTRQGNAAGGSADGLINCGKPVVIDADGLNWLAKQGDWWAGLKPGTLLLTPHVGEMARLTGVDPAVITADPVGHAVEFARKTGQVVLLKGAPSLVTDGTLLLVAADSPPSLATAGSGDVLTGTIGAFLAQGLSLINAAALALYVGAAAARRVEQRTGVLGLVASDLPFAIAEELKALGA